MSTQNKYRVTYTQTRFDVYVVDAPNEEVARETARNNGEWVAEFGDDEIITAEKE